MRLPPIALAGIVAGVILAAAIVYGLLTGGEPLPRCTPTPGVTSGALACETPVPS